MTTFTVNFTGAAAMPPSVSASSVSRLFLWIEVNAFDERDGRALWTPEDVGGGKRESEEESGDDVFAERKINRKKRK
jgi:hypothetical protein